MRHPIVVVTETTNTQKAAERLHELGFSEYESRAYVTLLREGQMTGYQLAKASGVPRPNIYGVLERLERRGAVTRVKTADGAIYAARPGEEMISGLSRTLERRLGEAGEALARLASAAPGGQVWNIEGYDAVLSAADEVMQSAQHELIAGLWAPEARRLTGTLANAEGRGVEVTTLCLQGCGEECGGCRGELYRYPATPTPTARWLVVAADGSQLIVGQMHANGDGAAAVTRLQALVTVGAQYLRNAIAAAELLRSLGPDTLQFLDDRARRALQRAGVAPAPIGVDKDAGKEA